MAPERYYIIAATPRTGSSLLCEGLGKTGIAGRPAEVFAPDLREPWNKYWSLSQDAEFADYLAAAFTYGTTPNGVYGLKIMWMHVPILARDNSFAGEPTDVLEYLYPGAAFVNIVRRDRRAQALSWYRAIKTNEWFRRTGSENVPRAGPDPIFNADAVRTLEIEIAQQQSAWQSYFGRRNLKALMVEYETLAEDYRGQVARVLDFLSLDPYPALSIPSPRLARQADALTSQWRRLMEAT